MRRLLATGTAMVAMLAVLATLADEDGGITNPPGRFPMGSGVVAAGSLVQFDDCEPLLEHLQDQALDRVTAWGLPGAGWWGGPGAIEDDVAFDAAPQGEAGAGRAATGSSAADIPDFSTTNVQEVGADEPDMMKTDGKILVTVVQQVLHVVDLIEQEPVELATMRLPDDMGDPQLLLDGDRLLVVGQRWGFFGGPVPLGREAATPDIAPGPQTPITLVQLIDLSDPTDPDIVADLELDGHHLSSRLVDGSIHLAISSQPAGLVFEPPVDGGVRGERDAIERNRQVIRDSEITDWLPAYAHRDGDGVETVDQLVDCNQMHSPDEFAGFGTLSIVSIDPSRGSLVPRSTVGVLSEGQTVYGSTERLYVSTTDWVDWSALEGDALVEEARDVTTDIHAFDITGLHTDYVGSGTAPGSLLNQFSMSEHDGHLRVATTEGNGWWRSDDSQSTVTTFDIAGSGLDEVGSVTGMGKGEQIYAVRFMGDVGYVVTFRQVDPLYVLDLSDPTDPTVEGELKIPGYSAYLHPASEGRLIGVGQDATDEGQVTGLQVSLFDVSDPTDPRRLSKVVMPGANSESEWDHHAFLYWPTTGTTVLPMQQYGNGLPVDDIVVGDEPAEPGVAPQPDEFFNGAVILDVADEDISIEGRISHLTDVSQEWLATIRRSFVRGDVLWTLSDAALVGVDLQTLDGLHRLDW